MMTPLDLAIQTKSAVEDGAWLALFIPQTRDETGHPVSWTPGHLPGSERAFRSDAVDILGEYLELRRRVDAALARLEDPAFGHRIMSRREIGRILLGCDPESGEPLPPPWTYTWPA